MSCHQFTRTATRREMLRASASGFGQLALAAMAGQAALAGSNNSPGPLAAKAPHLPARAKRVIFLHMAGAPSQLEMFDYKPELAKLDGKSCPQKFLEGKRFAFLDPKANPRMLGPQHAFS